MSEIAIERLFKILIPLVVVALIITALTNFEKGVMVFMIFFLIILGSIAMIDPESFWGEYVNLSATAALLTRVGGIVAIILSVIALAVVLFT